MKILGIRHYSQIARRAAEKARDKRPQFARVVRVDGARVDLQVGQSLTVVKNVEVIGEASQLSAGDTVQISWWSQDRPVAIAGARIEGQAQRITAVENKLAAIVTTRPTSTPNPTGGISDWQILRFSGGALASVHDPTPEGLEDAMAVSASGDMVLLPSMDLEANFTIPAGVTVTGMSRTSTLIRGTVTLSDRSNLEKVRMLDTETANGEAVGAISSGAANIRDCDIWGCNCGTGAANGARVSSGTLTITNSSVSGEAGAQPGYGVYISGGKARLYETTVYGSTAQYNDDNNVYVHGTLLGEASCECAGSGDVGTVSGSMYLLGTGVFEQVFQPFENGATLAQATALNEKDHLEAGWNLTMDKTVKGVAATRNHLFFAVEGSGEIVRMAVSESGADAVMALDTNPEDIYDVTLMGYSDEVVYASYVSADNDFVIARYNLTTQKRTEIFRGPAYNVAALGTTWGVDQICWMTRVKTGVIDKMMAVISCYCEASGRYDHCARIIIVDLAGDAVVHNDFYPLDTIAYEPEWTQGFTSTPASYDAKLVFTCLVWGYKRDLAGVSVCPYPTFIVDCASNTVERVNDMRKPIDENGGYAGWGGGIDRSTGIYYFWVEDFDTSGNAGALLQIPLNTQPYNTTVVSQYSYNCWIIQGKNKPYALQDNYQTDRYHIHALPSMDQIGLLDAGQSGAVADDEASYIWEVKDTEIHGISTNGGSEKRIPLSFNGSPYRYPGNRSLSCLFIFDNKIVVKVRSTDEVDDPDEPDPDFTITVLQSDFYLLGA